MSEATVIRQNQGVQLVFPKWHVKKVLNHNTDVMNVRKHKASSPALQYLPSARVHR